jgi:hypothetical protein
MRRLVLPIVLASTCCFPAAAASESDHDTVTLAAMTRMRNEYPTCPTPDIDVRERPDLGMHFVETHACGHRHLLTCFYALSEYRPSTGGRYGSSVSTEVVCVRDEHARAGT